MNKKFLTLSTAGAGSLGCSGWADSGTGQV
jgi:hypothetical protein